MRRLRLAAIIITGLWLIMGADTPPPAEKQDAPAAVAPCDGPAIMCEGQPIIIEGRAHNFHRGVVGGPHDFSHGLGNSCSTCHIPHMQAVRPTTQPSTSQPAIEMFRISGQRQVFRPDRFTPGPTSLICLGCHDGTIGTSTIGSSHALLTGVREGFRLPPGWDVWRDHPIGIPYPSEPREYRPEGFVIARGLPLPQGRLECISCHDPHNEGGNKYLLWMSNRQSALCLTCHIK